MFDYKEIIGIIASLFIVLSLCFKTTTLKGTLLLRGLNSVGSIIFVVYGFLLPAYATSIANILCLILNIIFTIIELKNKKKETLNGK